jgi:hypothetical protein
MEDLQAAQEWRARRGYAGRGGVVVVFDGIAQGGVNELRNPEAWRPGCVAVDESGTSWLAIGGNDQDGASTWMPRDAQSWNKRMKVRRRCDGAAS